MVIIQILFTHTPIMNEIFNSEPITVKHWLNILVVGLLAYFLIEFEKLLRRMLIDSKK